MVVKLTGVVFCALLFWQFYSHLGILIKIWTITSFISFFLQNLYYWLILKEIRKVLRKRDSDEAIQVVDERYYSENKHSVADKTINV